MTTSRAPASGAAQGVSERIRTRQRRPERSVAARVSVVIPCFNYARYLPGCIQSALSQDNVTVDVIVVDDASTDGSAEVAESIARQDPRITVVAHRENQGPVATYNDGLACVDGEFSVRLDADDLLTPGALARAVALFDTFPSVGLVYGHPIHFTGDPPPARADVRSWTVWPGVWWVSRRCDRGVNCITSPEVVMRQSVVRQVGGQRELAQTHDMEMWMRIASVSDVGHLEGPDQAWHREHEQSRSAKMVDAVTDLSERRLAFEMLFDGPAGELREADRMRADAHRSLAAEALTRASHAFDRGRVESTPVDWYRSFALEIYPNARRLRQWRALRRRERLGARLSAVTPPFVAAAISRRVRGDIAYRYWTRYGL